MRKGNPLDRAVESGRVAYRDGLPATANPYRDSPDGRLTWSRAWVKAWNKGWNDAARLAIRGLTKA